MNRATMSPGPVLVRLLVDEADPVEVFEELPVLDVEPAELDCEPAPEPEESAWELSAELPPDELKPELSFDWLFVELDGALFDCDC